MVFYASVENIEKTVYTRPFCKLFIKASKPTVKKYILAMTFSHTP